MDTSEIQTEAVALSVLAASNQPTRIVGDGIPAVILPEGFSLKTLENTLAAPVRKRGTTVLNDAESFIAVVNDQKGGATRLFSTIDPPTFTAVFNHHAAHPGWCDHRAEYNAPLSPEWEAWTGADGDKMTQVQIAQFIENNLVDVVEPDGATLLEIREEVHGCAQKGQLSVPEQFVIGIPVFESGDKWRVDVRLRYRIEDGGKLTMWLELIRPHKVIEQAVKELREQIAAQTELPILNGAASS